MGLPGFYFAPLRWPSFVTRRITDYLTPKIDSKNNLKYLSYNPCDVSKTSRGEGWLITFDALGKTLYPTALNLHKGLCGVRMIGGAEELKNARPTPHEAWTRFNLSRVWSKMVYHASFVKKIRLAFQG